MKKKLSRLLAVLLGVLMLAVCVPAAAFADEVGYRLESATIKVGEVWTMTLPKGNRYDWLLSSEYFHYGHNLPDKEGVLMQGDSIFEGDTITYTYKGVMPGRQLGKIHRIHRGVCQHIALGQLIGQADHSPVFLGVVQKLPPPGRDGGRLQIEDADDVPVVQDIIPPQMKIHTSLFSDVPSQALTHEPGLMPCSGHRRSSGRPRRPF